MIQRSLSITAAAMVAVAMSVLIGAPRGVSNAQDARTVAIDGNWRADLNRQVANSAHWSWILRRVERQGDNLSIVLSIRNNATNRRPIFLGPEYMATIALIDADTAARFPLLSVSGVSDQLLEVERSKSTSATFIFRYPEGVKSVRFNSSWIAMIMQGAASVIAVEFPLDLPPPEAHAI
jgi:hypothetical protein